jgi:hypothetical protein
MSSSLAKKKVWNELFVLLMVFFVLYLLSWVA